MAEEKYRFQTDENTYITVYDSEGLFQIVGNEQVTVIDDINDPNIFFTVSLRYDNMISFEIDEIEPTNNDGITYSDCLWEISILLDERDVLILDLDSEIIVTRNYDIFRLPFRYLLLSRSEDDWCRNLEYLGNCKPELKIHGKTYNLNDL